MNIKMYPGKRDSFGLSLGNRRTSKRKYPMHLDQKVVVLPDGRPNPWCPQVKELGKKSSKSVRLSRLVKNVHAPKAPSAVDSAG